MTVKTRVTQTIDLRLFSLLIDNGEAVFTASALMGCDLPGNRAYLSVIMQRSDGLTQGQRLFLSKNGMTWSFSLPTVIVFQLSSGSDGIKLDNTFVMQPYQIRAQKVTKHTRRVAIHFGVEALPAPGVWCYFDNMTLIIRQTTKTGGTIL